MSFRGMGKSIHAMGGAISRPRPRSSPWMSLQLGIPGGVLLPLPQPEL
jgi:hypothetical protein